VRLVDQLDESLIDPATILFTEGPLAGRLRERGHVVEVLSLSPLSAGVERQKAGSSITTLLWNSIRVVPFVIRLGLHLRALAPDVIHSTSLKADLIAVPVSWIAQRPLVWHVHDRIAHDYLPALLVWLVRFLARHAPRHVIVNSEATALTLPGVKRLTVAYPGFSPDQVGPPPARRTGPVPATVGILGRISPTKGQIEFVRAAARVAKKHPDVRFRIIGAPLFGEEAYAEQVRREVESLGLSGQVEFTGFVDDPVSALDGLFLCVHASGQPEPFGQVIVEAMVRGVPVVATKGGGVTEIMCPRGATEPLGWLVEPYDVDGLAVAVEEALASPETALLRAEAAYASALRRFPISVTARTISAVWRQVAKK